MPETFELAKKIADTCYDKIATSVVVLDLRQVSVVTDYYVIASAPTRVQINDITRAVDDRLSAEGINASSIQGRHEGSWVLLDYGSVVVHLFLQQERDFYNLEGLWHEAPIVYSPEANAKS